MARRHTLRVIDAERMNRLPLDDAATIACLSMILHARACRCRSDAGMPHVRLMRADYGDADIRLFLPDERCRGWRRPEYAICWWLRADVMLRYCAALWSMFYRGHVTSDY